VHYTNPVDKGNHISWDPTCVCLKSSLPSGFRMTPEIIFYRISTDLQKQDYSNAQFWYQKKKYIGHFSREEANVCINPRLYEVLMEHDNVIWV
jgi:hypothetical protein